MAQIKISALPESTGLSAQQIPGVQAGATVKTSGMLSSAAVITALGFTPAPINSPVFTGNPQGPTPLTADNSISLATTAFVKAQSYVTALTAPVTSVAGKTGAVTLVVGDVSGAAPLASPTFTGIPAGPTAAPGTNTTQLATTAFVTAGGFQGGIQWQNQGSNVGTPGSELIVNFAGAGVSTGISGSTLTVTVAAAATPLPQARYATTAALPANNYSNGASGVGATLTAISNGVLNVDGGIVGVGDHVLVKNEISQLKHGLYICNTAGAAGAQYVLMRLAEMDQSTEFLNTVVPVGPEGTQNKDTLWECVPVPPVVVGTTAIPFVMVSRNTTTVSGPTWTIGFFAGPSLAVLQFDVGQQPNTYAITGWQLETDVAGSFSVEVQKCTLASFPSFASMSGISTSTGGLPSLASGQKGSSSDVSLWSSTALNPGDSIRLIIHTNTGKVGWFSLLLTANRAL